MSEEIWKDIEGYVGHYQVSNLGRVKSLSRVVTSKNVSGQYQRITKEKILKPFCNPDGYPLIDLSGNKQKIHRLVAKHFIPNPLNLNIVNHLDGIKNNNKALNLEWVTCKENTEHAFKTGLRLNPKGEQSSSAKLTAKDVEKIRKLFSIKNNKELGELFNVKRSTISKIRTGVNWKI